MKKIFLIIIFILSIENVSAKTYYTEYSNFSDYSTNYIESSDITLVEEAKFYKYYNEEIVGDYYMTTPTGYILNNNNFKIIESEYSKELPFSLENREIIEKEFYYYSKLKGVSFIHLTNLVNFDINKIEVFYNDEIIDYEIKELENEYTIDLKNEYDPNNLKILFNFNESNDVVFEIILNNSEVPDSIFYKNKYMYQLVFGDVTYSDFYLVNKEITTSREEYVRELNNETLEIKTEYKTIDTYFYCYKINKIYSDYLEVNTNYQYKSNDYITYYRYKTRDKIEIMDDIVITDKNYNLLDYINSTNLDIGVFNYIDINKNGEYKITYKVDENYYDALVNVLIDENVEVIEKIEPENSFSVVEYSLYGISGLVFIAIMYKLKNKSTKKNS